MTESYGLKHDIESYDTQFVREIQLTETWYPQRVMAWSRHGAMLELGLGHGYTTEIFSSYFSSYLVVDGAEDMIQRFRERFPHVTAEIVKAFFEEFETDRRFPNIAMGFVLEHVDDPGLILRRFRKFLTCDGAIYIAVPNAESLHRRLGHAAGMLPDMTVLAAADIAFGHKRYFTMRTLSALVEECGYKVGRTEGLFLKPFTKGQIESLNLPDSIWRALMEVGVAYPDLCNCILLEALPR